MNKEGKTDLEKLLKLIGLDKYQIDKMIVDCFEGGIRLTLKKVNRLDG